MNAIKLIKTRNITSIDEVQSKFKSLAFKGWNTRDLDSISIKSQTQPHLVANANRTVIPRKNKSRNNKNLYLSLKSSSRYLSCIESPSKANDVANNILSPKDIPLQEAIKNTEDCGPEGSIFSRVTPIHEGGPPSEFNVVNKDNNVCKQSNDFLSDVYFIMQQDKKSFHDKMDEVAEYLNKNRRV